MQRGTPAGRDSQIPTNFVALLRGVSGRGGNRFTMTELVELFEEAGAGDVGTYLQGANVIFTSTPAKARRIAAGVTMQARNRFGLHVPILLRGARELEAVADRNPFLWSGKDPSTLHVLFLSSPPAAAAVAQVDSKRSPPDAFEVRGDVIYLHLPNGMGRTKLGIGYFEQALGTRCIARSWRSVSALAELARARGAEAGLGSAAPG